MEREKKCTLKQIPNRQKTPYYHVSAEVSIKMHLRDTLCLTDFLLIDITVIVKQKASKQSSFKLKRLILSFYIWSNTLMRHIHFFT